MSLARFPLPSIALVLTSDHNTVPSRPSVIKFEFDPLQTIHPTTSSSIRVSHPIEAQIDPTGEQSDNQPVSDGRFFFHVANDSLTTVAHSDRDVQADDDTSDAQTALAEKRPTTSRGSVSKGVKGDIAMKGNFMALASTIRSLLLSLKLRGSPINKCSQATKVSVDV